MRPALLLALLATPAAAAVNPCVLDGMVAAAPVVVQLGDVAVGAPEGRMCAVTGTVLRAFRGDAGGTMTGLVPCDGRAAPPGPFTWHAAADLRAPVLELHLDADGGVAGYGWGLVALPAPTDAPAWARAEGCG